MAQVSSAQPFDTQVLPRELEQIQRRRKVVFTQSPVTDPIPDHVRPFGLGLSGGGIRSATFNLGILQGLAEKDLLKYVDYLSTVSGGGYIGSWLHGLIRNRYKGDPREATKFLSPSENPAPKPPDEDPIAFLRKYSNYAATKTLFSADLWIVVWIWMRNFLLNQLILVPALSAVILLFLFMGFLYQMPHVLLGERLTEGLQILAVLACTLIPLGVATIIAGWNLRRIVKQTFDPNAPVGDRSPDRWSLWTVPLVFFVALVIGSARLNWSWYWISLFLVPLFLLFQLAGGFIRTYMILRPDKPKSSKATALFHIIWMAPAAAAVSGALIFATWHYLPNDGDWAPWVRLAFAPTLICLSLFGGVSVLLGLMGSDSPDGAREWISRIAPMIAIVCAVWTGLFVVIVFGPWACSYLLANYEEIGGLTVLGGWLLTAVGHVLASKSATGPSQNGSKSKRMFGWLVSLAPTTFMIGYLLVLAFAVHYSLRHITPEAKMLAAKAHAAEVQAAATKSTNASGTEATGKDRQQSKTATGSTTTDQRQSKTPPGWLTEAFKSFGTFANEYFYVLAVSPRNPVELTAAVAEAGRFQFRWLLIFLGGCVAVTWVASSRININEFSMNHFYKNRLVGYYLGATNSHSQQPNALTGFDPADDFSLALLVPEGDKPYCGPYPIINTALNLNAGSELAQQERTAVSFVFTPMFCGFAPSPSKEDQYAVKKSNGQFEANGYRSTQGYSAPSGPNLGTAMAISGAAANLSSGYQTSGPMAFLMSVFDARLGWWLGNPRWKRASQYPGPLFALKYLFLELLGQTTGRTKFVNLSDGGHFDNLGLYELVRRRCRYIIVCDAEQDRELTFGSLGEAIRKCRVDFGVEIDIDPKPIRIVNEYSTAHCVMGTIEYPEDETGFSASIAGDGTTQKPRGKARGWLLYLKSSLTGDEPWDVIEYRSRNPKFPHESTGDQFFSESQFESYRRLGLHVVRDAFDGVRLNLKDGNEKELVQVFQDLTRKWYTPTPVTAEAASRLADSYSALMRSLGEKTSLGALVPVLLPNLSSTGKSGRPAINQANMVFGLEVIQLIENVYTEFGLQHRANRANPRNAGWMEVFRRWAENDVFYQDIWESVRQDYNPLFQQFMEELRVGVPDDVPLRP